MKNFLLIAFIMGVLGTFSGAATVVILYEDGTKNQPMTTHPMDVLHQEARSS